jgi:hypothetical protein
LNILSNEKRKDNKKRNGLGPPVDNFFSLVPMKIKCEATVAQLCFKISLLFVDIRKLLVKTIDSYSKKAITVVNNSCRPALTCRAGNRV